MSKHDLEDYRVSLKQSKDLPSLIKKLDNFREQLYPYFEYDDVKVLYDAIMDAKVMLDTRLFVAKAIVDKKGQI